MMIRVMIVEDEPVIRNGIATVLPWSEMGCQVVALAENGQDGLEKAAECAPHLVISDIRMPRMDGLDMIEGLIKIIPKVKIILLTGYKEFEYAKRAIEFGVSDYILKPVDQEQLENVVRKLTEEIENTIALEKEREALKSRMEAGLPIIKDKFIADLLFHNPNNIDHIREKMKYFQLEIGTFVILVVEIDSFHDLEKSFTEDDVQLLLFLITEQIEALLGKYGYSSITFNHKKSIYAIMGSDEKEIELNSILEYCRDLAQNVEKRVKFTVSIGISSIYDGAMLIQKARREADKSVRESYYLGSSSVICYQDLMIDEDVQQDNNEVDTGSFYQALKNGIHISKEAKQLCDQLKDIRDDIVARSMVSEVISRSFRLMNEEYGESQEIQEYFNRAFDMIHYAKTLKNLSDIIKDSGIWMEQIIQEKQLSRTEYTMNQAIQYMKDNCKRELSLEEVASSVYVSKWYLSKLFHKEKGIKFSDYLSALRIEEAQRIIREDPSLKNYEVAEIMGYGNDRYFSQVFKKVTGMTPSEFRG